MKPCPKHKNFSSTRVFLFFCHFVTVLQFLMWNMVAQEALFMSVVKGRCIHDQLEFAIKEQSPQSYEAVSSSTSNKLSSSTTAIKEFLFPVNDERSIDFHENVEQRSERNLARTTSKLFVDNITIVHNTSSNLELFTTKNNPEKHRNASTDAPMGSFSFSTNSTMPIEQQNFSAAFNLNVTYKPIRITVWYDFNGVSFGNNSIEFERLKQGLDRSLEVIKSIFSVIPVKGNLLLKRLSACGSYWQQKCGRISLDYRGETCLDGFQVPDSHLGGFVTYDRNETTPSEVHFLDGEGIPNSDTVIYVRALNTRACTKGNIIAYTSNCQLDQFYRPIAGYANFCPSQLITDSFDANKFYLGAPATGSPISPSLSCERQSRVVDYLNGWQRVLTPRVMEVAGAHFNCSMIGGPLEGSEEEPSTSSHWESRFLQPSIMTSSIGLPHLTVLDPITLALFSDTGWYKVNMSLASPLFWGRGSGCQFGSLQDCRAPNNSFFCTASSLAHGCHYLHLDKGVCKSDEFLDSCEVYKPEKGGECWDVVNQRNAESWKGESYSVNSRCFISNISPKQNPLKPEGSRSRRSVVGEEGRCYEQRCNDTSTLEIRVKGSSWVLCKSREKVQIPDYDGYIICPPTELMCNASNIQRTRTRVELVFDQRTRDSWPLVGHAVMPIDYHYHRKHTLEGAAVCVKIMMIFDGLGRFMGGFPTNESAAKYQEFMRNLVHVVNNLIEGNGTSVAPRPHAQGDLIRFGLKSQLNNTRSCTQAVKRLKMEVEKRNVRVSLEETSFAVIKFESTYTLQPCSLTPSRPNDGGTGNQEEAPKPASDQAFVSPGVIAAAAVGGVCVTVFAAVWVILYAKSVTPSAVGPVTGLGPEVSYQPPNSRGSPPSLSESGSMGQIQFSI